MSSFSVNPSFVSQMGFLVKGNAACLHAGDSLAQKRHDKTQGAAKLIKHRNNRQDAQAARLEAKTCHWQICPRKSEVPRTDKHQTLNPVRCKQSSKFNKFLAAIHDTNSLLPFNSQDVQPPTCPGTGMCPGMFLGTHFFQVQESQRHIEIGYILNNVHKKPAEGISMGYNHSRKRVWTCRTQIKDSRSSTQSPKPLQAPSCVHRKALWPCSCVI